MHEIRINSLTYSNFLSYGNNVNEFPFLEGLTWIRGPVGAGKSVNIDALSFVWFKRQFRDVDKIIDLKNNANKSKLKAEINFDRISSGVDNTTITDNYIIKREMTNSGGVKTEIILNKVSQNKSSGITQKQLEMEVLGFNKNIFENIISLNTIQTTPIIDMTPKDKRQLIESVLTLHIDKYKDKNKKELKEAQTKCISAQSDVEKYSKDADELKNILEKLKAEKDDDIKHLEIQVVDLGKKMTELSKDKDNLKETANGLTANGVSKKKEYEKYENLYVEISNYNVIINDIQGIEIARNDLVAKIEEVKKAKEDNDVSLEKINKISAIYSKEKLDIVSQENSQTNKTFIELNVGIANAFKELKKIEKEAKSLKAGVECPTCGKPSTEADINKIKDEYRKQWKEKNREVQENTKESKSLKTLYEKQLVEMAALTKQQKEYNECKLKSDYASTLLKKVTEEEVTLGKLIDTRISRIKDLLKSEDKNFKLPSEADIQGRIKETENEINKGKKIKEQLDALRGELIKTNEQIKSLETSINSTNEQIGSLTIQITEKKKRDIDGAYFSTEEKLKGAVQDLERAHQRVTKYSDAISIHKYMETMFADDGIKKFVLKIFMPNLNKTIAHNLTLFELPFAIEFDDAMEYKFSSKFGSSKVYGGLSQGQQRKLNFAISMAFRDFVMVIADFKINVLFLDEVVGQSMDLESTNHLLELLKKKVKEIGGIYVMVHREDTDLGHQFDNVIEIEHDGRYSTLSLKK